jgi:hypothetical protein
MDVYEENDYLLFNLQHGDLDISEVGPEAVKKKSQRLK